MREVNYDFGRIRFESSIFVNTACVFVYFNDLCRESDLTFNNDPILNIIFASLLIFVFIHFCTNSFKRNEMYNNLGNGI